MNPADHISFKGGGVDALVVADTGGGPAAGQIAPPSVVRPNPHATAVEDNALAAPALAPMPRAEIQRKPVQGEVNGFLNAMMGKNMPANPAQGVGEIPQMIVAPPPAQALPTPAPPQQSPQLLQHQVPQPAAPQQTEVDQAWGEIEAEIHRLRYATGQIVLDNPTQCDGTNVVHVAIWNMRYNPQVINMDADTLCLYEAALSAHQAWVQSVQNWWQARYEFLGPELSRVVRKRLDRYPNLPTVKAREDAVYDNDPDVERLRREHVKAKTIAMYLTAFGERFAQLENGIKRAVNQAQERERREGRGSRQHA